MPQLPHDFAANHLHLCTMLHHFDHTDALIGHLKSLPGTPYFLTDTHCLEHCWPALAPDFKGVEVLEVDPGEDSKSVEVAAGLWAALLELGADRNAHLITLGGGVVTDLGGFVASTYKRGIKLTHIPTSVLAMVDAAVGGKTGINMHPVKNQVGTFYTPHSVCLATGFMHTLPFSELRSGYGEMLKHAFLMGPAPFDRIAGLELTSEALAPHIFESAQFKTAVAEGDLLDNGRRQMLNLGHSIGHALEGALLHSAEPISHGTAVAWGMVVEARIAVDLGICKDTTLATIQRTVEKHFSAILLSNQTVAEALELLAFDKKNEDGKILMSLPIAPGKVALQKEVPLEVAEMALRKMLCA